MLTSASCRGYCWGIYGQVAPILLVGEDDAFPMYAEYLRHRGLEVTVRTSPDEALTELGRLSPAVIVTELAFGQDPQRGGEFIATVRQHPSGQRSAVVIVVTGFVRVQDAAFARQCGADQFFAKPLVPEALEIAIKQALASLQTGQRPPWNGPTAPLDRRQEPRRKTDSWK
jgi:CheY-like chemotaxis protein